MIPHNPRTLAPRTLSPQDPFTLSPFTLSPQDAKLHEVLALLGSLWVPGCSLKALKPCKNAGFFFLQAEKHCKNAGKMHFLRTQGSKKLATWPLEMRC